MIGEAIKQSSELTREPLENSCIPALRKSRGAGAAGQPSGLDPEEEKILDDLLAELNDPAITCAPWYRIGGRCRTRDVHRPIKMAPYYGVIPGLTHVLLHFAPDEPSSEWHGP